MRTLHTPEIREEFKKQGIDDRTIDLFIEYLTANKGLWKEFLTLTLQLINKGVAHYGAAALFEVIRFHRAIEGQGEFKCNNNFRAYFARLFALKYEEYADFFETREVKGLTRSE